MSAPVSMKATARIAPAIEQLGAGILGAFKRLKGTLEMRFDAAEARIAALERAAGLSPPEKSGSARASHVKSYDDHESHRTGDLVRDSRGAMWRVVGHLRYRRIDE